MAMSEEARKARNAYKKQWLENKKATETPAEREERLRKGREAQKRYWEKRTRELESV